MRLLKLRLHNFRQHADTEIDFGEAPGLVGIIGPNGSGKSTILEAIAWAIYGTPAARGDKDSVRNLRAKPRSSVEVELVFSLGRHEYSVVRGLYKAELYEDRQLVANAQKDVSQRLERVLRMTREEFFNTYFTGQKDLTVMAKFGPSERRRFLARVLGYERLELAQEEIRARRNSIADELRGLEQALPDRAVLEEERRGAEQRIAAAREGARAAEAARREAQTAFDLEQPRWQEWVARRERLLSLDGELRMAQQAVETARQEFQRIDRELAEAKHARDELARLAPQLEPVERIRRELSDLERLQGEEAVRREEQAKLDELQRLIDGLERRLADLAPAMEALPAAEHDAKDLGEHLRAADDTLQQLHADWVREQEYATAKRADLREQYKEFKEQRDRIAKLGPEGECPTCHRPLGREHGDVLALLDRQLQQIVDDGKYFSGRVDQLAKQPLAVTAAETERDSIRVRAQQASERAGQLAAQAEERRRASAELESAWARAAELERRLAGRPTGYDAARHEALRGEFARLEPLRLEGATLEERARRAEALGDEIQHAERAMSARESRAKELSEVVAAEGFAEAAFEAARKRFNGAEGALREAQLAVVEQRGELTRAEEELERATARQAERAEKERLIADLQLRHRLHNELDRAMGDLRTDLNTEMRPEISEIASGFLADLTDGRYDTLDLTEDYELSIVDDGLPKPVISGGEEDLANLVLRLAISQMIAERAGQPLSLLVLDEIFGSLDDARRQHVVSLLRRLGDRFPQVILITHIEQVRDGLDRVIRVEYDAGRGTSVVRDDTTIPGSADAGVAA
jgi:exonuclease SbcC